MSKKNTPAKIGEYLKHPGWWVLYKKGMCDTCEALCCYMPVEVMASDLVRMGILDEFYLDSSLKEQTKEALKHPGVTRYTPSNEKYTLTQKQDTSCYFLDANKRCSVYENRPDTCRNHPKIGTRPNYCAYMKKED